MEHRAHATSRLPSIGWAAFLLMGVVAVFIASGIAIGPLVLLAAIVGILFAYHYSYVTFGIFLALVPLMGLTVSISTGELSFGRRAFGGSIDIWPMELVALFLLGAWIIKILWLWVRRNDINWKPWFPLALPMAGIVATHMLSVFSPFQPDTLAVVKYAIRPVLWSYLLYVGLSVNFIRSRRALVMALSVIAGMGILASFLGLMSLGIPGDTAFPRARPTPLLGVSPLGDNHNLLGEWLAFTIPVTAALVLLLTRASHAALRRLLIASIALQAIVALLTFSRTVWIVLAFQALAAGWFVWRAQAEQWLRKALVAVVLLIPIAAFMLHASSTAEVAGSTSSRLMLTEISLTLWSASPWIGMGAGTFVDRIGTTQLFLIEHGAPLDSHGLVQKLLTETGVMGLAAFALFVIAAFLLVRRTRWYLNGAVLQAFTLLSIAAGGALVYQLFNTNYWTGKLWLPIGIMLAASRALTKEEPAP